MSLNKIMLIGNLGQDPEVRQVNGTSVCNFSVATSEKWTDKDGNKQESTEWHRVNIWNKSADACGKYLKKGSPVYVEGKVQTRKYEKDGVTHYSTEIKATNVQFLSSSNKQSDLGSDEATTGFNTQAASAAKTETKAKLKNHAPTFDATEEMPF